MSVSIEGSEESRSEVFGIDLPELPASEWLHEAWISLGRAGHSFNGAVPFQWAEIESFARAGGYDMTPVEARTLHEMSVAFSAEAHDRSPLRIAPMEKE